jgi:uncharacterized delta-60 repeat protein
VAVQADGQILVVGNTHISCSMDWNRYALARYDPDGTLDTSFGTDGTQTTNWGSVGSTLSSIGFQSDGKIIVSGTRYSGGCSPGITNSTVTRYTGDGELDTTFGSGGETRRDIPYGPHHDYNRGVVVLSDDSIVAVGSDYYGSWAGTQHYDSNGSYIRENGMGAGYGGSIDLDSTGRILVSTNNALVRLDSSGSLETTFAVDGVTLRTTPYALTVDGSDRALILADSTSAFQLIRYEEGGGLDESFGTDGMVTIDPGYSTFRAATIGLQSDGKIIVGGTADSDIGTGNDFALARICP